MAPNHFRKDPEIDLLIREQFLPTYEAARAGKLNGDWSDNAVGSLAQVIVLDQFPRNMFRDTPQAFATDEQAMAIATAAIDRGFDDELPQEQLAFLYMPFMHAESLAGQDQAVMLFEKLGIEGNLIFAMAHRDVIMTFGRFPHRNEVLGRRSTPEEQAYLAEPGAGF